MDIQTKKDKGWDYFLYALYAFAGLGIEVLLAFFIEPIIYGCSMNEWSTAQNISHWVITCMCWGLICFFLAKDTYSYQGKYYHGGVTNFYQYRLWSNLSTGKS